METNLRCGRKAGLSDADAQDVVQETIIAVAKKMPEFHYDPAIGSFKAWLKRVTRWRITDQWRKKGYEDHGHWQPREMRLSTDSLACQPDQTGIDLERTWNEEWEKHFDHTGRSLSPWKERKKSTNEEFATSQRYALLNLRSPPASRSHRSS